MGGIGSRGEGKGVRGEGLKFKWWGVGFVGKW